MQICAPSSDLIALLATMMMAVTVTCKESDIDKQKRII